MADEARKSEPAARVPSLTEISAVGAGILYTVGFVVSNVYRVSYEPVRFEFFRGRYVAAAMLFASAAAIPGYVGWQFGGQFRSKETKEHRVGKPSPKWKRALQIQYSIVWVLGGFISALPTWWLLQLTAVGHISPTWVFAFALAVEIPFMTLGSIVYKARLSGYPARNYVTGPRPGFVFFFTIFAAALFGRQIYPYISPAFGGGAATLARLDFKPGSVPDDLEAALSRPVAIVDRDDHLVEMAVCADSGNLAIRPVSLPSETVRVATLNGLVAMPEAAPRLCAREPTIRHTTQIPDWCQRLPRPQYRQLHRVPSADPWFEVYAVTPSVFAIYEPHQAEEAISFLILGKRRAALFDTGLGIGDIKKVATGLTRLPIVVLNSHTHDDHVGDNWEFTEILGMDTQFTRTSALGSVADAQGELTEGSICGQLPPGFDPKAYATRPWQITRWMHDGDTVDLGGRVLRVLATPGHTPDSICLLDEANGLLWTGDSYYPGTIWLKRPETDLDAYERSMTRIAALVPRLHSVLGSHNAPVAEPSILTKLVADIRAVRSGRVPAKPAEDGNVTYDAGDGIMFLMHPR